MQLTPGQPEIEIMENLWKDKHISSSIGDEDVYLFCSRSSFISVNGLLMDAATVNQSHLFGTAFS